MTSKEFITELREKIFLGATQSITAVLSETDLQELEKEVLRHEIDGEDYDIKISIVVKKVPKKK